MNRQTKSSLLLIFISSVFLLFSSCSATMKIHNRKNFKILKETPIVIQIQNRDMLNAEPMLRNELLMNGYNVISANEFRKYSSKTLRGNNSNLYYPQIILLRVDYSIWVNYSTFNIFNVEIVDFKSEEIISIAYYNQNVNNAFFAAPTNSVIKKFVKGFEELVE